MPGPGATDPADLRAHARAHLGLSRQLEQTRRETPHPSRGGRGYDTWFRRDYPMLVLPSFIYLNIALGE
jgi:hypothetical protein